jgi:hypothetical protein
VSGSRAGKIEGGGFLYIVFVEKKFNIASIKRFARMPQFFPGCVACISI